jgi:hypothetical protein
VEIAPLPLQHEETNEMTSSSTIETYLLISLPESVVAALIASRHPEDVELSDVVRRLVSQSSWNVCVTPPETATPTLAMAPSAKYEAEFLGEAIGAQTWPDLFARIVDITCEIAPEAIEGLAAVQARSRRYVARRPEAIHPGRPDLPVMPTGSGWWISKNVGREDVKRALRVLADVAGLRFGVDVRVTRG